MRAAEHAPRGLFQILECPYGLADIVEACAEDTILTLKRHEEAKALYRKTIPVARRVLGDSNETTLRMRSNYAVALVNNGDTTLDDLREGVGMLAETARTARRVFGGAHPLTTGIEGALRQSRAALASETP